MTLSLSFLPPNSCGRTSLIDEMISPVFGAISERKDGKEVVYMYYLGTYNDNKRANMQTNTRNID